jgi:2,3-bisphosphoglycerate-dependent phosphoglycerate mutase
MPMTKPSLKGKLVIARHHESEWNKLGKWTGTRDRHLTPYGFQKSEDMGFLIRDIQVQRAFASMQVRSIETLSCMLNATEQYSVPIEHSAALNERDYGEYTGKNKWEMEKIVGPEEFNRMRLRSLKENRLPTYTSGRSLSISRRSFRR